MQKGKRQGTQDDSFFNAFKLWLQVIFFSNITVTDVAASATTR